ncbi:hypothetical protein E2C01_065490 [Portunus trituberculatus]|uniref:Uncharacterized protein n=1 Tax=Portunus trituberculatus TaxID=210409 RepID=A0A5B7HR86_PORTR|nr:hypothetical protein [Portunus trituberculatus]
MCPCSNIVLGGVCVALTDSVVVLATAGHLPASLIRPSVYTVAQETLVARGQYSESSKKI